MTERHCRIGSVKLRGGATLHILPDSRPREVWNFHNVCGSVRVESTNGDRLTLERALFLLEMARLNILADDE